MSLEKSIPQFKTGQLLHCKTYEVHDHKLIAVFLLLYNYFFAQKQWWIEFHAMELSPGMVGLAEA